MVLNLRLMPRAQLTVRQAFGSLELFQRYVNENVGWIFEQTERRYINHAWVVYPPSTILLVGSVKVVLAKPRVNKENEINYVILTLLTATRNDRSEALAGREVNEEIRIYDHDLLPAIVPTTSETTRPAATLPEDNRAALPGKAQELNANRHGTPALTHQLLDRIQQGETAYFCLRTGDLIATSKADAPCEACKQPNRPDTHPRISKALKRGKANTVYYCETTGNLIVGDEAMRYCEFCGEPSSTHRLIPVPTQKAGMGQNDATRAAAHEGQEETKDRQHFIVTVVCPECNTNLAPGRGAYCQHCGLKLPSDLAVHPEVVVAIKRSAYDKLAIHLKQKVNVAWSQLLRGRRVDQTLNSMGQTLFIISVEDENRTSTLTDEQRLDSTLTATGIGRLTTDPYELKEAHRIMDRKPSAQPA